MSNPFSGFKYSAPSAGGNFAKAAASFVEGLRAEQDRKKKEAMDAALFALRQNADKREGDQFTYSQKHDTDLMAFNREKAAQEAANDTRDYGLRRTEAQRGAANDTYKREGDAADRAFADRQQTETERENRAKDALAHEKNIIATNKAQQMIDANPRRYEKFQDTSTGEMLLLDKLTNTTQRIMSPGDAATTPSAPGASGSGSTSSHVVTGSAIKAPASMEGKVATNQALIQGIDAATTAVENDPEAFGMKGLVPEMAYSRAYPEHVDAYAAVFGQVAARIHELIGAAQTKYEYQRLEPFLPTATDPPEAIKTKLARLKLELQRMNNSVSTMYNQDPQMRAAKADADGAAVAPQDAQSYYNSLRKSGMSADDAQAKTLEKYPK